MVVWQVAEMLTLEPTNAEYLEMASNLDEVRTHARGHTLGFGGSSILHRAKHAMAHARGRGCEPLSGSRRCEPGSGLSLCPAGTRKRAGV